MHDAVKWPKDLRLLAIGGITLASWGAIGGLARLVFVALH